MRCDSNSKCPCIILILGSGVQAHIFASFEPETESLRHSLSFAWNGVLHSTDANVFSLVSGDNPVKVKAGLHEINLTCLDLKSLEIALWNLLIPQGWMPEDLRVMFKPVEPSFGVEGAIAISDG